MRRFVASSVIVTAAMLALASAPGCSLTGDCNLGLVDCRGNGICTSLASDEYNCGACGHPCPAGSMCVNSACTPPSGPPIVTSVALPPSIDPNEDGTYTLHATVWYADDHAMVDSFDFDSSVATVTNEPLSFPSYTGSAAIVITLPATAPVGTLHFTLDVAAGGVASAPFGDSVVLR